MFMYKLIKYFMSMQLFVFIIWVKYPIYIDKYNNSKFELQEKIQFFYSLKLLKYYLGLVSTSRGTLRVSLKILLLQHILYVMQFAVLLHSCQRRYLNL